MYYLCSENKGADQLHGHREAVLRLCFRKCKMLVFSLCGSFKLYVLNLSESMEAEDLPGLKVMVRELDDVLFRDVGNRIADSGK